MIEVLFFSVLTVGVITEILYKKIEKYKFRLSGLINSILEKKSSLRP